MFFFCLTPLIIEHILRYINRLKNYNFGVFSIIIGLVLRIQSTQFLRKKSVKYIPRTHRKVNDVCRWHVELRSVIKLRIESRRIASLLGKLRCCAFPVFISFDWFLVPVYLQTMRISLVIFGGMTSYKGGVARIWCSCSFVSCGLHVTDRSYLSQFFSPSLSLLPYVLGNPKGPLFYWPPPSLATPETTHNVLPLVRGSFGTTAVRYN